MHGGKNTKGICPVSFGLAWGIVFAVAMIIPAWVAYFLGTGSNMVTEMGHFYSGYDATMMGGLWGGFWGLIEGFLMGFFIALLYDCFTCCCKCSCCKKSTCCNKENACGCNCNNNKDNSCCCNKKSSCCCHKEQACQCHCHQQHQHQISMGMVNPSNHDHINPPNAGV